MPACGSPWNTASGSADNRGTPIKASDFKGSIERLLKQDSQGAGLGYTSIKGGAEYNFRREGKWQASDGEGPVTEFAAMAGTDPATYVRERPGMSAFALEDGVLYHTYSAYSRGLDGLWGMYQWLDRAPKGRNEGDGLWWKRRDEYGKS